MILKAISLPYLKIQKTRVGISFNPQELDYLGKTIGLEGVDEKQIKRRVME